MYLYKIITTKSHILIELFEFLSFVQMYLDPELQFLLNVTVVISFHHNTFRFKCIPAFTIYKCKFNNMPFNMYLRYVWFH